MDKIKDDINGGGRQWASIAVAVLIGGALWFAIDKVAAKRGWFTGPVDGGNPYLEALLDQQPDAGDALTTVFLTNDFADAGTCALQAETLHKAHRHVTIVRCAK